MLFCHLQLTLLLVVLLLLLLLVTALVAVGRRGCRVDILDAETGAAVATLLPHQGVLLQQRQQQWQVVAVLVT